VAISPSQSGKSYQYFGITSCLLQSQWQKSTVKSILYRNITDCHELWLLWNEAKLQIVSGQNTVKVIIIESGDLKMIIHSSQAININTVNGMWCFMVVTHPSSNHDQHCYVDCFYLFHSPFSITFYHSGTLQKEHYSTEILRSNIHSLHTFRKTFWYNRNDFLTFYSYFMKLNT
jgi:hypothetical protein